MILGLGNFNRLFRRRVNVFKGVRGGSRVGEKGVERGESSGTAMRGSSV